jgi:hypothetical protein
VQLSIYLEFMLLVTTVVAVMLRACYWLIKCGYWQTEHDAADDEETELINKFQTLHSKRYLFQFMKNLMFFCC